MQSQTRLALFIATSVLLVATTGAAGALSGQADVAALDPSARDADVPLIRAWDAETAAAMDEPVPEIETGIGPGSALRISHDGDSGSFLCTANFIWTDDDGRLYLGTAGHCLLPEGKTATHGPEADHDRNATSVQVRSGACPASVQNLACGAGGSGDPWVELGDVAYAYHTGLGKDFGIVEIPPEHQDQVRYELPTWGGPTGEASVQTGDTILHYGQGVAYGETFATRARVGVGGASSDNAWETFGFSNPGDSGSAIVSGAQGADALIGEKAVGILTHGIGLEAVPVPGLFSGTHIDTAKQLVGDHTGLRIWTLPGGEPLAGLPKPEPGGAINRTLEPGTVVVHHEHNETTTTEYNYTWSNDWDAVRITLQTDTENGEAEVTIRDETGEKLFETRADSQHAADFIVHDAPKNTWNVHFAYQDHTGTLALRMEEQESKESPQETTETGDEGPAPEGQSLSAPGIIGALTLTGLLLLLVQSGRRRGR